MQNKDEVTQSITHFLQHAIHKVLLIIGDDFDSSEFQQILNQAIANKNLIPKSIDVSQADVIDDIHFGVPVDKPAVFIFTCIVLKNLFFEYNLDRWQNSKVIFLCSKSLLHPKLDPSIYFAPIKQGRIQRHRLTTIHLMSNNNPILDTRQKSIIHHNIDQHSSQISTDSHFLNQRRMTNDLSAMQMLADRAITSEAFKQFLFELVYASREDKQTQIAAANAVTALNYAKVPFSGLDLSGISIAHANLRNAILEGANVTDANLENVNFSGANLNYAKLNNSRMDDVIFGEYASIDKTHEGFITSVKYSPDGELLATASNNGKVGLWFVDKGLCKAILEEKTSVDHLVFSPKGSLIGFTRGSRISIIYFKEDLDKRLTLNVKQDLVSLAFSSNEPLVIAASDENIFKWYYKKEHVTHLPIPNAERYRTFILSEDASLFAAGDRRGGIDIFSTANMKKIRSISSPQLEITALCFNRQNTFIASGSNDNTIWIFPLTSSAPAKILKGHTKYITALCFDPTDKYLISGSWDETIRLWNLSDNNTLMVYQNHSDPISCLSFHPDGLQFASGSKDQTVRRWNLKLNQEEAVVNYIYGISMSPNRFLVATASDDFTIRLWHIRHPGISVLLKQHSNHISGLFFSTNSQRLASVDIDHQICIWNTNTGEFIYRFTIQDEVRNIIFGQSNIMIIIHSENCFSVFDKDKNLRKVVINSAAILALRINAECHENNDSAFKILPTIVINKKKNYCAFTAPNHEDIVLWDLKLNKQVATARGHFAVVMSLSFSPDDSILASTGNDNTVRLWRMPDLSPIACLIEHTDAVTALAWHPHEQILASAGHDKTICLWKIGHEKCQAKLEGHQAVIRDLFFTNDGKLVSGGRSINIWQSFHISGETRWYRIWTSHTEFSSIDCNIDSVRNLSYNNLRLMKQSGATDNPIDEMASAERGHEVKKQLFEETLGNLHQNLSQIFQFMQARNVDDDDAAALEAAIGMSLKDSPQRARKP